MRRIIFLILLTFCLRAAFSQRLLISWSQQHIENYTKELFDAAQKLSPSELLRKNLDDKSWSAVFLTLNASVNNYSKDTAYLKALAQQLTNKTETKLEGTSRLVIWDRIISGDILFEGKGLVIDNDLFQVSGRANQILQSLTKKHFGNVSIHATSKELEGLRDKWLAFLAGTTVEEDKPIEYKNATIAVVSSLTAIQALIVSLQENTRKQQITANCLKKVYHLDEMPKEKGAASYCNPDTYTYSYLGLLFGDKQADEAKDARWWLNFWNTQHDHLVWNSEKGIYEVKG